jgi:hypothetical protein
MHAATGMYVCCGVRATGRRQELCDLVEKVRREGEKRFMLSLPSSSAVKQAIYEQMRATNAWLFLWIMDTPFFSI